LEEVIKMFQQMHKASKELQRALMDEAENGEAHLERMAEYEKRTYEEDGIELSDEDLAKIMQTHKESNPFASNRASALARFTEAMRGE